MSLRDERLREAFDRWLLAAVTRDLAQGWQLALDVGRPAVPLLLEMLANEKANLGRRLAVLGAAVLAAGTGDVERLFGWLDNRATMHEERILVAMIWALGPRHARPQADFWARLCGPVKQPSPMLGVAGRLAAARFPGSAAGVPPSLDEDVGLAAAAAFADLPLLTTYARGLWNLSRPERHAELFWRAALLGALPRNVGAAPAPEWLERARELLGPAHPAAVRSCAAVFLQRWREVRAEGPRPEWWLLQDLAGDGSAAQSLAAWLGPVPQPLDEEPGRLAVAYALSRSTETVVAERLQWGGDARVRRLVAVTLAYRLLGEDAPTPVDVALPGVPEWFLVCWASGRTPNRERPSDDAQVEAAIGLAAAGRLPRPAARTVLEEALWRWGVHPGRSAVEAEQRLVRDLLLLGSGIGGKFAPHLPSHQIYLPGGIDKDHAFFEIAIPLWEFMSRPRLPLPPEHRLR
mgnify:CR=1 FL=1